MSRLINYIQDTKAELKHVSWPTRQQAIIYTALVIGISLVVAAMIGALDFVFTRGLNWFVN